MNDSSTSALATTTRKHTKKPAVNPPTKTASKAAPTSKIPVKAPRKSASPAPNRKPVKAAVAPVAPTAAPAKAKTSPSKAPQAKAADKKKSTAPAKAAKEKKVKVVRDSFTLPKTELLQITEMKKRAMALGVEVKKSELIRAGLQALAGMADTAFKKAMANVPTIKTGRPAKD
ncbi:hypothetical protein [Limnohabitans sp.]|uniref:hypothetical protein n=1 Tax=Limnohabitans sp. TaxID=1907725 RepID=UPI0025C01BC5|nr:hypothetical protein [Limnohabitans sp.]